MYPAAHRAGILERLPNGNPTYEVADPYRWLENPEDPETVTWSAAQHELFQAHRDRWALRGHFAERIAELLSAGAIGVPVIRGDRTFFMRRSGDQEHAVLYVHEHGADGAPQERVLIDPMLLDPAGTTTLDSWQPSKEGNLLAYQLSQAGTEESVLRVLRVCDGQQVDGPIDRTRVSPVAWLRGGQAYYYVRRLDPALLAADERQYHRRVWLHRVGTDPAQDVEIFGTDRPMTDLFGVSVSWDGRWLLLSAAAGTDPRNDVWLADLADADPADPPLREVIVGVDARTSAHLGQDGRLYLNTDLGAPRGRIAVTDPATPQPEHWHTLIAERQDAVLEGYLLRPDAPPQRRLLVSWTRHAVAELTTHTLEGASTGAVALPGLGSLGALVGDPDGGTDAWFSYTDYISVPTVYRYDTVAGELHVHARTPGAISTVFVLARADLVDAGDRPVRPSPAILYGYGGFGASLTPAFSANAVAWVEQGGVYAVANLRGGSEEGEQWHRDGMLGNKQRVFDDFLAAAQSLIGQGWTTSEQLAASGGSNGGLLVGAALTQRPDMFGAVACSAPLLDMVRYQRFGLGRLWVGEYGDAERAEDLGWLLSYSPYHRVRERTEYPATLFLVFGSDSRVDPLHARKMAAALQHATGADIEDAPVLLRAESEVGHGARAVSRAVPVSADTLAFLAAHTGLDRPDRCPALPRKEP